MIDEVGVQFSEKTARKWHVICPAFAEFLKIKGEGALALTSKMTVHMTL